MVTEICVDVVYALPEKYYLRRVALPTGSTVKEAIVASGILLLCPEIVLEKNKLGIFSRVVTADDEVRSGDRVEIYRPLLADPKELRRRRAERAGQ